MNDPYDHLFKVIVAGCSGVGKTSILNRYVESIFPEGHFTTIGVDFKIKTITVYVNGVPKQVKLQLWDTAGQERFQAISASYFRGTHGIFLVFSLSDLKSFEKLDAWMQMAEDHKIEHRVILGNKADTAPHVVSEETVRARYAGTTYLEVSAKTGQSINEVFTLLANRLTEQAILNNDKGETDKVNLERPAPEIRTGNRCCGGTG
jgi:small GTP-binding protein